MILNDIVRQCQGLGLNLETTRLAHPFQTSSLSFELCAEKLSTLRGKWKEWRTVRKG